MTNEAEKIDYYGYTVYKNGKIVSPRGNELEGYCFSYQYSHITMKIDGKSHKIHRAKLIYELFSGTNVSRKDIVRFKDKNPKHCAFENLYLESRKDYSQKHPRDNSRKFSKRVEENIRKKYYDERGYKRDEAPSLRELAKKYKCSLSTIQKVLRTT